MAKLAQLPQDQALARLRLRHPGWDIWVVNRVYGGPVWCARPAGADIATHNAGSAAELDTDLYEAGAGG